MVAVPPVAIAPHDRLLRRVLHNANFLEWHYDLSRWVPSLAAVRFDPDGMSAFLRRLLEDHGLDAGEVATLGGTSHKPAVVYEFGAQAATAIGYATEHTPNDDTPIGYAHASILAAGGMPRPEVRKARTELANSMTIVHGDVSLPRPPGA